MTTLLLDTDLDPVQRDYAQTIGSSAETLLTVINDILDFSKIEAGKLDLEEADFLLRPLVEDTVGLLASAAQVKGLEITALVDAAVPAAVRGDSHRLRQVLTNLVGNAVKFTQHGEVAVHVTTAANGIRFTVRDTGIGIAPAERERLFQSFTQADTSTTRRYGGTGLGLTISRQLVQLMEGTLDFISEPGRGTTFWVDLPLPRAASPLAAAPLRGYPTDARVLVVDDNATNLKVLRQFLTSWSLEPHDATDGPSALAALRGAVADGTPFDAVLLDMRMPGMSGIEVAREVNGDPALAGTPIAVLTSTALDDEAAAARTAGVELCLTKPVREAQLYDCVSRLLGTTATRRHGTGPTAPRPRNAGRLLVAEDNAVNQRVVVAMLEALGFDVDVAPDGQQALELFAAGTYAAVLMDCQMPRLDGYAATRALRGMGGRGAEVPIIALTASALASDEARCREAGMDDFITKPLRPDTLARVLDRWVGATRPGAPERGDPLDPGALAELRDVDVELATGVVAAFLDTVPKVTGQLRDAVGTGDAAEVRRLAHGIRGSAGYVGAPALVVACGELEAGEPAESRELLAALEDELERVYAALRIVMEGSPPKP
jgi:CheY-like chemotaxis protein/HPt (histidine-containing phosphotransfer) domain-containing protein/anti-sigma regulatory factor (Ser/Thr protein kinase)